MSDQHDNTNNTINLPASKVQDDDIDYWKAKFEESKKKRIKVENDLKKSEAEIKELKKENSKTKKEIEESKKTRIKVENDFKMSEDEEKNLEEEIEESEDEEKSLEEENSKIKKEIEEFEAKTKELNKETSKIKKEIEESEAKHEKLSFKTLITAPPKVELSAGTSTSLNVMSNPYKTAEIKEVEITFKLKSTINKNGTRSFELDDYLYEETRYMPSTLLLHFYKLNKKEQNFTYDYYSGADISSLIQRALEDATYLAQCKTGRNFATRYEYSIFSPRPDHLVVFDDDIPLLTVEYLKLWNTKKDNKEANMEMDLSHTYGQLYDYAMMMRASQTHASFLILTCFKESRLLWLDSNQGDADVSPDKNIIEISTQEPQGKTGFQSLENERVLNASVSFDSTHFIPLVYTAILRAVMETPHKPSKLQIPLLDNEELKDYKTLKMGSGWRQYDWGQLSATVGQEIDKNNCYYMVDIIGMGNTSKVFYALHSSGKPCVIKMFVNRAIEGMNGETLSKEGWMKLTEEKTKTEKENFDNLYPSLKDEVKAEMILGFHCVVMPFFTPLKNNAERQGSENEIKQVLKRFHENKLQYLDYDLHWCHIGRYKEEIILYDLADLTLLADEESSSDVFVNKCWKELQDRLEFDS